MLLPSSLSLSKFLPPFVPKGFHSNSGEGQGVFVVVVLVVVVGTLVVVVDDAFVVVAAFVVVVVVHVVVPEFQVELGLDACRVRNDGLNVLSQCTLTMLLQS